MKYNNLFKYFGGKYYLLDDILAMIYYAYKKYDIKSIIDVFGGSAKVLINIPIEWNIQRVYNDIDYNVYSIIKVIQDKKLFKEFNEKISRTIVSEKYFYFLKKSKPKKIIDKAYKTWYLLMFSYASRRQNFNISNYNKSFKQIDIKFYKIIKKWVVLNKDYKKVLDIFKNKEKYILYLDPPYINIKGGYFEDNWTENHIKELSNLIHNIVKDKDKKRFYILNETNINIVSKYFGKPFLIKEYTNQLSVYNKSKRTEGFWTNIFTKE